MKRQSVHIAALTLLANDAMRNECVFAGRLAAGFRLLPLTNARRKLKAKPEGQRVKKAISQFVAYPCCQVIIFVLRKKLLVQLRTKISCLVAFEALFLKGHDYVL